uniref:Uncharacterized protein n=1 Tax=Arundo donax TaxID=35708 RepID=A0A0A9EGD7_ARUDO
MGLVQKASSTAMVYQYSVGNIIGSTPLCAHLCKKLKTFINFTGFSQSIY